MKYHTTVPVPAAWRNLMPAMKTKPPLVYRTSTEGLAELRYAVDCWFACMTKDDRQHGIEHAHNALTAVPFNPNAKPRGTT